MSILKIGMYASQFPTEQNYLTFSSDAPFSIKFNQISWDGVLEYSVDAQNWYTWDASEINSVDNTLYLRGSGNSYITGEPAVGGLASYAMQITATDGVECSGNIMSLLDHVNVDNAVMGYGTFSSLFFEQDKLITSPELPAMTLAENCYSAMFQSAGIVVAPELPATQLAEHCYNSMFYICTNLVTAPELPATVLVENCYNRMLFGTGIKISLTQTGIYQTPWRIPSAGNIAIEQAEWNTNMIANTSGTFRGNPAINTTYYQAT